MGREGGVGGGKCFLSFIDSIAAEGDITWDMAAVAKKEKKGRKEDCPSQWWLLATVGYSIMDIEIEIDR